MLRGFFLTISVNAAAAVIRNGCASIAAERITLYRSLAVARTRDNPLSCSPCYSRLLPETLLIRSDTLVLKNIISVLEQHEPAQVSVPALMGHQDTVSPPPQAAQWK